MQPKYARICINMQIKYAKICKKYAKTYKSMFLHMVHLYALSIALPTVTLLMTRSLTCSELRARLQIED